MTDEKKRAPLEKMEVQGQQIARTIDSMLPDGWLFSIQFWTREGAGDGLVNYVSNCDREDVIKGMKSLLKRWKRGDPEL